MAELLLKWKRPVILQIPLAIVNVCFLSYCYSIYVKHTYSGGTVFYLRPSAIAGPITQLLNTI